MKKANLFILTAIIVANFSIVELTRAHEALLSPRAREAKPRVVFGGQTDPNLVNADYLGTALKASLAKASIAPGTSSNIPDLNRRPLYTGKNPVRELHGAPRFELAPVTQPR